MIPRTGCSTQVARTEPPGIHWDLALGQTWGPGSQGRLTGGGARQNSMAAGGQAAKPLWPRGRQLQGQQPGSTSRSMVGPAALGLQGRRELYGCFRSQGCVPGSPCSQKLLRSPRKPTRKISKIPFKVLDAPELQDDFYLNLVDWSSLNVLSVGLGTCVYLWSACTSQVGALSGRACRLGSGPPVPAPATLSQVPEARVVDQ